MTKKSAEDPEFKPWISGLQAFKSPITPPIAQRKATRRCSVYQKPAKRKSAGKSVYSPRLTRTMSTKKTVTSELDIKVNSPATKVNKRPSKRQSMVSNAKSISTKITKVGKPRAKLDLLKKNTPSKNTSAIASKRPETSMEVTPGLKTSFSVKECSSSPSMPSHPTAPGSGKSRATPRAEAIKHLGTGRNVTSPVMRIAKRNIATKVAASPLTIKATAPKASPIVSKLGTPKAESLALSASKKTFSATKQNTPKSAVLRSAAKKKPVKITPGRTTLSRAVPKTVTGLSPTPLFSTTSLDNNNAGVTASPERGAAGDELQEDAMAKKLHSAVAADQSAVFATPALSVKKVSRKASRVLGAAPVLLQDSIAASGGDVISVQPATAAGNDVITSTPLEFGKRRSINPLVSEIRPAKRVKKDLTVTFCDGPAMTSMSGPAASGRVSQDPWFATWCTIL